MISQWWLFGFEITAIIVILVALILLMLLFETIFLKIALGITKSKHNSFGSVFVTALVIALIGWIPCIGCILSWVVINSRHDTGFGMAIVVWIITWVIGIIITFLIIIFVIFPLIGLIFIFSILLSLVNAYHGYSFYKTCKKCEFSLDWESCPGFKSLFEHCEKNDLPNLFKTVINKKKS